MTGERRVRWVHFFCYKHALYKHALAEIFYILSTLLSTLSASDLLVTIFSEKIFERIAQIYHEFFISLPVVFLVFTNVNFSIYL